MLLALQHLPVSSMKKYLLFLVLVFLTACKGDENSTDEKTGDAPAIKEPDPIELLRTHLSLKPENQPKLAEQKFSTLPLTRAQAEEATKLILDDRLAALRAERQKEFDAKAITIGDKTLKYEYRVYGNAPADGHSLYISMHGGGGAPARVNDQQWKNQIRLYKPKEGIYVAPRAPTDTWDLWHQRHIDQLFDRLIANFIAIKGVNPNKVYVMGYSAGGDGTYQLAPRMADRWAGAAMMAGHPGDAQTYNLRNLAYIIQCGGKDAAYKRNILCAEWGKKLDKLAKEDPGGYPHKCIVYPQYGHWMNLECKQAVPWMAKYTRNPWPKKLHWYQDNVTHTRFHWLSNKNPKHKQLITAEAKGQTVALTLPGNGAGDFTPINDVTLRLSDKLLDLDKPVVVKNAQGKVLLDKKIPRTIQAIYESIQQRPDASSAASALLVVPLGD